jgi:hypothetical protein
VQPPPSYSLGGTVSGLSGAGLVLADNNAQTVAVNAGATTFTFGSELNSGTAYAVTVQTQPAGQTCTVANGSGTVTANVANAVVTCAAQPIRSAEPSAGWPRPVSCWPTAAPR